MDGKRLRSKRIGKDDNEDNEDKVARKKQKIVHKPSLVTFNVGGTKYQVSRSLLEQHPNIMLSRMVSATWQREDEDSTNNNNEAYFIERNGARFAFVLDYMRDGFVSLPGRNSVCTKSGLLKELIYFGFTDVDENSIDIEFSHMDASNYIVCLTEDFVRERNDCIKRRENLNLEIACLTVAHGICVRRMKCESSDLEFSIVIQKPIKYTQDHYFLLKKKNKETMLDFQVIDAINESSSLKGTRGPRNDLLNKALHKYGIRASFYSEYNDARKTWTHETNRSEENRYTGLIKVTVTVHSI